MNCCFVDVMKNTSYTAAASELVHFIKLCFLNVGPFISVNIFMTVLPHGSTLSDFFKNIPNFLSALYYFVQLLSKFNY